MRFDNPQVGRDSIACADHHDIAGEPARLSGSFRDYPGESPPPSLESMLRML
jgi:hypothetical protein